MFYDSNFRPWLVQSLFRDRGELDGELPCGVPSGWPRIFFVIYWRRKSVAEKGVRRTRRGGELERVKWVKGHQTMGMGEQ